MRSWPNKPDALNPALRELFRATRGTHIFRAADGVYLYHIHSHYDDAS